MPRKPAPPPKPISEQEFLRRILGNLQTGEPSKVKQAENAIRQRLQQSPSA